MLARDVNVDRAAQSRIMSKSSIVWRLQVTSMVPVCAQSHVKIRQSYVLRTLYVLTPESGTQIDVRAGVYFINKPSYDLCGCARIDLKQKYPTKSGVYQKK